MAFEIDFDAASRDSNIFDDPAPRLDLASVDIMPLSAMMQTTFIEGNRWIEGKKWGHQTIQVGTMPHVHLDFRDSDDINAYAFGDNDCMFIGINRGLVITLYETFLKVMSTSAFSNVGETEDKRVAFLLDNGQVMVMNAATTPEVTDQFASGSVMYVGDEGIGVIYPRRTSACGERTAHALRMWHDAMRFLIGHELAHIRNGHVEMPIPTTSKSPFAEYAFTGIDSKQGLILQTLEMDADAWATVQAMSNSRALADEPSEKHPLHWAKFRTPYHGALYDLFSSIHVLFRVLNEGKMMLNDFTASHPPSVLRQQMIAATGHSLLSRDPWPLTIDELGELNAAAVKNAVLGYAEATSATIEVYDYYLAWQPPGLKHLNALKHCWSTEVRPSLLKTSHASDLP